jgi:hypothetical protein
MRCRGVQGIANAAYLEGIPFPALLRVALYCVPGGIRLVSISPSSYSSASPPSLKYLLMRTPPGSSPSAPKPFSCSILATRRFSSRYSNLLECDSCPTS